MKKRTPLYDTRTYTLENKDIPLGVCFAVFCLGLAVFSIRSENVLLAAATSLSVYLAVLLSSNRTRLLVPVALCLPVLLQLPGNFALIRVIIFASIIGLTLRRRESVIPLILLLALWATYLNLAEIAALLGKSFYSVKAFDIKLALTEVTGFLILLMLLWCRQFPALFGRLPREVEIATVSFVLFLLATLVGAGVAFTAALSMMGISFEILLTASHKDSAVIAALTGTLVAIPFTLSVSLNRLIKDFGKRVEQILAPNSILGPVQLYPKIVEFNEIFSKTRELLDEQDRKTRELELNIKNTLAQKEEKDKESRQRISDADNLSTIFSICPTGVMALSGSGAILAVTPALVNQFSLNNLDKYIGRYYLELQATEEAPLEDRRKTAVFLQFIGRLISEQKTLARSQALRSFLKIDSETYSEMTVYVFDERIVPVDWKRISTQLPPSDVTLVIFSNAREDHRRLILNQLFPRNLEIIGGQSLETLAEVSNLATLLDAQVATTTKALETLQSNQFGEMESQLRALVRTTSDFSLELRALLSDNLEKGISPLESRNQADKKILAEQIKSFNLTQEMQSLLHLFEDLYGLDAEILFSAPEATDSSGNTIKQEVRMKAIPFQFNEFKSMFIALLAGLAAKADGASLSLAVGTEQIGMNTAALFRGSSPGRYARITLSHPGQSITSNLMPDNLQKLPTASPEGEELAVALGIFSLRVQRMRGFLSIQSSPAKGTYLTIYLPEDPQATVSDQDNLRKVPQNRIEILEITPEKSSQTTKIVASIEERTTAKILVVEDSQKVRQEVIDTLSIFSNISVDFVSRAEATQVTQDQFTSGAGFGSSSDIDQLFQPETALNYEDFDLVIIPVFKDLAEGMKLIKKITQSVRVAVVTTESDYADALSALYSVISYPFKAEEIVNILEEVLS